MKIKLYWIAIALFSIVLNGCQLVTPNNENAMGRLTESEAPPPAIIVTAPPQLNIMIDWENVFSPLVTEMLKVPQPISNNVLLVSDVKNNTNDYLPIEKINASLTQVLKKKSQYHLVDKMAVYQGKQALGISADDKLLSRAKMVALARYLKTDLVLFASINQLSTTKDEVNATLELLSTKTGEIIWHQSIEHLPDTVK
jgi:penicillin-binding protein activator